MNLDALNFELLWSPVLIPFLQPVVTVSDWDEITWLPILQIAVNTFKLSENYWYYKSKLLKLAENIKSSNLSLCFSPHCILSEQVCYSV